LNTPLRDVLSEGAARLFAAGIESARLDARLLLAQALHLDPDRVFALDDVGPTARERFRTLVERRAAHEPIAYITGTKEFWRLSFAVGAGVLIPRPETEVLLDAALRAFGNGGAGLRVLDIGTGSGCLLVSFLVERAEATGVGVDPLDAALVWASENVAQHGVSARCRLESSSWEPAGKDSFEVILANPPYLSAAEFDRCDPDIRRYEPRSAFVAGEDGLDAMRALAPVLFRRLALTGRAFVEIGNGQAPAVAQILAAQGLDVVETISDLSGIPRCLVTGRAG
jgi:release factor glutamine methyltransferase